MGNLIINVCAYGPYQGINSALETLVSQAFGAKNIELCGIYLQRGRIVTLLFSVPILTILIVSHNFLEKLNQSHEVNMFAYKYLLATLPGLILLGLNDL